VLIIYLFEHIGSKIHQEIKGCYRIFSLFFKWQKMGLCITLVAISAIDDAICNLSAVSTHPVFSRLP
tara:strand:- start:1610 stop:1810 length:201 start_codon:yes stop_codon:yes gene_type:complete